MDLLTSAREEFGLWKMAEKIRTCGRRRSNGGHNVGCDVGLHVIVRDVDLRSSDVSSSYSYDVESERNNSSVSSSSSSVVIDNARILGLE